MSKHVYYDADEVLERMTHEFNVGIDALDSLETEIRSILDGLTGAPLPGSPQSRPDTICGHNDQELLHDGASIKCHECGTIWGPMKPQAKKPRSKKLVASTAADHAAANDLARALAGGTGKKN